MARYLAILLMLVLLAACAPVQPHAVMLDAGDDGSAVTVAPGQLISVVLPGNPTTGYTWAAADLDPAVLAQVSSEFGKPATDAVGASTTQTLIFRAVAPGATALELWYARPWESVQPAETFTVQVAVQ